VSISFTKVSIRNINPTKSFVYLVHYNKVPPFYLLQYLNPYTQGQMKKLIIVMLCVVSVHSAHSQVFEWARNFGGSSFDYGNSVAVDVSGNLYVTGQFQGIVDFDPGPGIFTLTSTGNWSMFVSKFDASGNFVWAKLIASTWSVTGYDIALDASGNIYLTGYFSSTTDFDPGPGVVNLVSAGQNDVFILKLNASGNYLWAKRIGGSSADYAWSVAVDVSGNVYTTGEFLGTVDFDPGTGIVNLTSAGQNDIFVLKLDASGNFVWARRSGSTSHDYSKSIATDASGNVYVAGSFQGTSDFDPGTGTFNMTTAGLTDIFVWKLDASGNFIWARQMGGLSFDESYGIALDNAGNILTTGFFQGTADFDPGSGVHNMTSAGVDNVFVSKLDSSGSFVWAKQFVGTGNADAYSIAVDLSGNVYTTGFFDGTADFNPGTGMFNLTAVGQTDVFISKLDASGNFAWALQLGGLSLDIGNAIALDANGRVHTTGYFQETVDFDPGSGVASLTSNGGYDVFIHKITQCTNTSAAISPVACFEYLSPSGKYLWNASGTYMDTIANTGGCDSIITINLTINMVDTAVSPNPPALVANAAGAAYQWLDCGNGHAAIAGATGQSFIATANGSYAVEVTQNGCTDTSACYNITNIGVPEDNGLPHFVLYPNPTTGLIHLALTGEDLHIEIYTMLGEKVQAFQTGEASITIDLTNHPKGVYLIRIREARGGAEAQKRVLKW
jgi:hypothetical protein